MGKSSGASGLSTMERVMVPVTSRAVAVVPSRTVTSTMFEEAPMLGEALMVMAVEEQLVIVIFAVSSA